MNINIIAKMEKEILEGFDYKQYLWDQAQLFASDPSNPNYQDYNNRFWEHVSELNGMMRLYSVATSTNKVDAELYLQNLYAAKKEEQAQ